MSDKLHSFFSTEPSVDRHTPVVIPTQFTPIAVVLAGRQTSVAAKTDDAHTDTQDGQHMTFFAALCSTIWEMTEAMWMVDDGP